MIPVSIVAGVAPVDGRCLYVASDYYLLFEPEVRAQQESWRLSVDTLSFAVAPETRLLIGLDAYAPISSWTSLETVNLPLDRQAGGLRFEADFDFNGIASCSADGERVAYELSRQLRTVRIVFKRGRPSQYISLSDNLVAGVDDGELSEIWMLNVDGVPD